MKPGQDLPQNEGLNDSEMLVIRLTELAVEYVALRELYDGMGQDHRDKIFPQRTQESLETEFNIIHNSLLEITKCLPR